VKNPEVVYFSTAPPVKGGKGRTDYSRERHEKKQDEERENAEYPAASETQGGGRRKNA